MIKHIVMFKLKESAEGADKVENLKQMKTQLEALKYMIPEIKFFEVGINFSNTNFAYDLVLCSEFESMDSLYSYQRHPEHLKVADFVHKVCESRIVADYAV